MASGGCRRDRDPGWLAPLVLGKAKQKAHSFQPLSNQRQIELELYQLACGRYPHARELELATAYLAKKVAAAAAGKDAKEAEANRAKAAREGWEDTLWALLNTKEFLFNH